MDTEEFNVAVPDEYICGICHNVMIKPVCCREGHSWCESCIGQWLQKNDTCPVGREQLNQETLTRLRPFEMVRS
jgi:hypothetical protein